MTVDYHLHQDGKIAILTFNRPKKLNVLSPEMYDAWLSGLERARDDDSVRVVIVTGAGRVFSAGHELVIPTLSDKFPTLEHWYRFRGRVTKTIVDVMINFPKVLIAAVNGPAIGFSCTTLALYDFCYAIPESSFRTPFMPLGLCVEGVFYAHCSGCSSVTFPNALGKPLANEMLILGHTKTAKDLYRTLITDIFPRDQLLTKTLAIAEELANLPEQAVRESVTVMRRMQRNQLLDASDQEMDLLAKRLFSEEFIEAAKTFMTRGRL